MMLQPMTEVHGVKLISDGDRCVAHWLEGGFENQSIAWWQAQSFADRVVLDIGAYTGLYAIIAAKRGAKVYAFEPLPNNIMRIIRNNAANRVDVTTVASAVSDRQGEASFSYNSKIPHTSGGSMVMRDRNGHTEISVRTVTIDAMRLFNVAAMKIDVERAEPAVIRGALATIEQNKPALLIETLDEGMRETISRLLPAYRVAEVFDDDRNTLFLPT